jgi:hypothetical protein
MSIPYDIISEIIRVADLSVDTRLDLSRTYYVPPRRIVVPDDLKSKLDAMNQRRSANYGEYKRKLVNWDMAPWAVDLDRIGPYHSGTPDSYVEIFVTEIQSDTIEFLYKSVRVQIEPVMSFNIQTTTCDIHTGKPPAHNA